MSFWKKIKKAAKKVGKAIKKAVKKVVNTVKKIIRAIQDIVQKIISVFDFIASYLGFQPKKYMYLYLIILKKDGKLIVDLETVKNWYNATCQTLLVKCKIEVLNPTSEPYPIKTTVENAPDYALNVGCSFKASFGNAADYFEHLTSVPFTSAADISRSILGYRPFLFIIFTEKFSNNKVVGCAVPLLCNYIVIASNANPLTISHEIGHVAWLSHRKDNQNLMHGKGATSNKLTRWQISQIRTCRYAFYFGGSPSKPIDSKFKIKV